MAKVIHRSLSEHSSQAIRQELKKAFKECGVTEKGMAFLFGLLTESEIIMLGRRLQIARKLLSNIPVHTIEKELHVGQTTVDAVTRWLEQKLPGYRRDIYAVKKGRRPSDSVPTDPFSFRTLRRRYPMEFLLINLLLGDPRT